MKFTLVTILLTLSFYQNIFCKKTETPQATVDTNRDYFIVTGKPHLNVRKLPSILSEISFTVPYYSIVNKIKEEKQTVTVNGISGKWFYISFENQEGWAFDYYLSKDSKYLSSSQAPALIVDESEKNFNNDNSYYFVLRRDPSRSAEEIMDCSDGYNGQKCELYIFDKSNTLVFQETGYGVNKWKDNDILIAYSGMGECEFAEFKHIVFNTKTKERYESVHSYSAGCSNEAMEDNSIENHSICRKNECVYLDFNNHESTLHIHKNEKTIKTFDSVYQFTVEEFAEYIQFQINKKNYKINETTGRITSE
jgi:hypothetical protein